MLQFEFLSAFLALISNASCSSLIRKISISLFIIGYSLQRGTGLLFIRMNDELCRSKSRFNEITDA